MKTLRNHNGTNNGNVDFRSFKKFHMQSLENKYEAVDLPVQKLLNDMTFYYMTDSRDRGISQSAFENPCPYIPIQTASYGLLPTDRYFATTKLLRS